MRWAMHIADQGARPHVTLTFVRDRRRRPLPTVRVVFQAPSVARGSLHSQEETA